MDDRTFANSSPIYGAGGEWPLSVCIDLDNSRG